MKLKTKWRKLNPFVYENTDGHRIHTDGVIRYANESPQETRFDLPPERRALEVMGGNKRRALMLLVEKN